MKDHPIEKNIFSGYMKDALKFEGYPDKTISVSSSGYVMDTLHASFYCLINTNSYKECVLKAVNLGDDTDTTAAVVGVLAGLYYGRESIPKDWIDKLKNKALIEELCDNWKYT